MYEILHSPYFDGENIDEMTAEQLRDFAQRRIDRARTELERQMAAEDNEMLYMLARARVAEAKSSKSR